MLDWDWGRSFLERRQDSASSISSEEYLTMRHSKEKAGSQGEWCFLVTYTCWTVFEKRFGRGQQSCLHS